MFPSFITTDCEHVHGYHFFFATKYKVGTEPAWTLWPVLYNLQQRWIIRGPPGKPLSSRSAKRPQCQQISSTQLVPNRAGWHTHKRTQTLTHTVRHQQHSLSAQALSWLSCWGGWQMEMLCLLKDQAVGYRSGLTYGTSTLELLHWLVSAARVHLNACFCVWVHVPLDVYLN